MVWKGNSCATDTLFTIYLYLYHSLTCETLKQRFSMDPRLSEYQFQKTNPHDFNNVAQFKIRVLPSLQRWEKVSQNQIIQKVTRTRTELRDRTIKSIQDMNNFLCPSDEENYTQKLLTLNYNITHNCLNNKCVINGATPTPNPNHKSSRSMATIIFQQDITLTDNVQSSILSYFKNRTMICPHCQVIAETVRVNTNFPLIINISREVQSCTDNLRYKKLPNTNIYLDDTIIHNKTEYYLFAVAYFNLAHYISIIKFQDKVYLYDGIIDNGKLKEMRDHTSFPSIYLVKNSTYFATSFFYRIKNIELVDVRDIGR